MSKKSKNDTEFFLQLISDHLSSHTEYKKTEYLVKITKDSIMMSPHADVFPDIHHRKLGDKEWVVDHVMKHHNVALNHNYFISSDDVNHNDYAYEKYGVLLLTGTYIYQFSSTGKTRKWTSKTFAAS